MAITKLEVELDLDSMSFTGKLSAAGRAVRTFSRQVDSSGASLKRMERSVGGLTAKFRDYVVILGQLRGAMHTIWGLTGAWVSTIVDASAKMERFNALLKGMSKASDAAGKSLEASRDMGFVLDMARNAPFQLDELANSFVKLKSAGIDPTTGSMQSLVDAVANFGGNEQTLHRATIAIQQMAGKGVVSMEELRQQLGEAVPNAIQLMARSANMSMGDLIKQISLGRVEAQTALKMLMAEFEREFKGSAANLMNTWGGMVSRLKTEWLVFASSVGNEGLMDALKVAVDKLTSFLRSPDTIQAAQQLGKGLADLVVTLTSAAEWLVKNRAEIVAWGKVIATVLGARLLMQAVAPLDRMIASFGGLTAVMRNGGGVVAGFGQSVRTLSFGPAIASTAALGAGIRGLFATMAAAMGPVGIIAGALALLTGHIMSTRAAAQSGRQAIEDLLSAKGVLQGEDTIAKATERLNEMDEALARIPKTGKIVGTFLPTLYRDIGAFKVSDEDFDKKYSHSAMKDLSPEEQDRVNREVLARVRLRRRDLAEEIRSQQNLMRQSTLDLQAAAAGDQLSRSLGEISDRYSGQFEDILKALNDGTMKEDEARKKRAKILQDQGAAEIEFLEQERAKVREKMRAASAEDRALLSRQEKALTSQVMQARERMNSALEMNTQGLKLIGGNKGEEGEKEAQRFNQFISQIQAKIADLNADLVGGDDEFARFMAMLNSPANPYGPISQAQIDHAKELTTQLNLVQQEIKEKQRLEQMGKKAVTDFQNLEAKMFADLETARAKLSGDIYSQVSGGMVGLERTLHQIGMALNLSGAELENFVARAAKLRGVQMQIDAGNFVEDMRQMADAAAMNSITNERQRALAELAIKIQQIRDKLAALQKVAANNPGDQGAQDAAAAAEQWAGTAIDAVTRETQVQTRPAWQQLIDSWNDTTAQMDQAWANSMSSAADALLEFVSTGKGSFTDLMNHILKEIARVLIQKAVAQFAEMIISFWNPGAGGAMAKSGTVNGVNFGNWNLNSGPTSKSAGLSLAPVPTAYAPVGGGSKSAAQDGSAALAPQNPNVQVNVINQSGQQMQAEQGGMRFDGKQFVLDVVLKAVSQPGSFRDSMRSSMR